MLSFPLPQEAMGKEDTAKCRRVPQFPIPQTRLAVWKSWQLLSDLLHQVIPSSLLIGIRTLAATDLLPSFPLSPLWQTHPEPEPHPLLFSQLHTPLQVFQSHSCSPPPPHSLLPHPRCEAIVHRENEPSSFKLDRSDKPASGTTSSRLSSLCPSYKEAST